MNLNLLSELNIGQILLFGFWGTCVVIFYSIIVYSLFNVVRNYIINLKNRVYGKEQV